MDRVHYRRVMPSRLSREEPSLRPNVRRSTMRTAVEPHDTQEEDITPGETVIVQCIISGIILVVVLMISLVDIGPASALRDGLRETLAGASNVEELMTDIRAFGEEWLNWAPSETPEYPAEQYQFTPTQYDTGYEIYQPPGILLPPATSPEYYFPLTAEPESSNPQNPGPSVVPGLWD